MEFEHFLSMISKLDKAKVGGLQSHLKMIPKERKVHSMGEIERYQPRKAAVMALFYPNKVKETNFLLILRADYQGTHASQIGFPGGKYENNDLNLEMTALRETHEEIGIKMGDIGIKKQLTDTYIPPSNFIVRPYLGVIDYTPKFIFNHEVKDIIEIKVSELLDDLSVSTKNLSTSYMENIEVPCFEFNKQIVWGATAMMLSEIKDLIKENIH